VDEEADHDGDTVRVDASDLVVDGGRRSSERCEREV
jgi:hypothetical protein